MQGKAAPGRRSAGTIAGEELWLCLTAMAQGKTLCLPWDAVP